MQATAARPRAIYCFECLCGKQLESESTQTECPWCHREIRLVWPAESDPVKPVAELKPMRPAV
jgi:hypothetical protein